jgi:diadenosine tetraphosphatase ApaH/serine/threonine PP2A family protein phosphatase
MDKAIAAAPRTARSNAKRFLPPRLRLAACAAVVALTALAGATAQPLPTRALPPVEVTFQGTIFRIPREYVVALFRSDHGALDMNLVAETFEPYTAKVDPDFPRNFFRIGLRVFLQSRGPGRNGAESIRFWMGHWASLATEPAEDLDADAATAYGVPRNLRFRRSLLVENSGTGTREDRFVPAAPRHDARGAEIPEAIFCMGPFHPLVQADPSRLRSLRCEYRFPFRDFETAIYFERHLPPQWQRFRERTVALLESFTVPQEAERSARTEEK